MEQIFIAGIVGFIAGGITVFVLKDKVSSIDAALHSKIDALTSKVDAVPSQIVGAANQLATHVTQQVATIAPKPPAAPAS